MNKHKHKHKTQNTKHKTQTLPLAGKRPNGAYDGDYYSGGGLGTIGEAYSCPKHCILLGNNSPAPVCAHLHMSARRSHPLLVPASFISLPISTSHLFYRHGRIDERERRRASERESLNRRKGDRECVNVNRYALPANTPASVCSQCVTPASLVSWCI